MKSKLNGKPLLQALSGQVQKPVPFWLMRQAGRYLPEYRKLRASAGNFLDFCLTPALAVEATLQPIRRFHMDAAILFSDILVVPLALGQKVEFREGEGPVLEAVRGAVDLAALNPRDVRARLAPVYEALDRLTGELDPNTALIGFAGAPWTLAAYMVEGGTSKDFAHVRAWAQRPDFDALIGLLTEAVATHLIAQCDAGAEAVQIFDSWAGILDGADLRRLVIAPTAEIVRRLKVKHPLVPVIGFPRGIGAHYPTYARQTGVDALSLDQTVVPEWAARELQPLCPVQGNLDPQVLVQGGEALRQAVARILAALAGGPFVFNLGHGVVPETPVEHVAELTAILRGTRD